MNLIPSRSCNTMSHPRTLYIIIMIKSHRVLIALIVKVTIIFVAKFSCFVLYLFVCTFISISYIISVALNQTS